jgi:hypothetical protein
VELAIDWNAHRNCSIPAAINDQGKRRFRIRFRPGPDAIFLLEAEREVIEVIKETCGMVIVS